MACFSAGQSVSSDFLKVKSKEKVVDEALTSNKTPIPLHIGQIAGREKHHTGT